MFADLRDLPTLLRWPATAARAVFATALLIGVFAFVVHAIVFFTAFHYAASSPTGQQICRITDHGHSKYVVYAVAAAVRVLEITMLIGMFGGGLGHAALDGLLHLRQRRLQRGRVPPSQPLQ